MSPSSPIWLNKGIYLKLHWALWEGPILSVTIRLGPAFEFTFRTARPEEYQAGGRALPYVQHRELDRYITKHGCYF